MPCPCAQRTAGRGLFGPAPSGLRTYAGIEEKGSGLKIIFSRVYPSISVRSNTSTSSGIASGFGPKSLTNLRRKALRHSRHSAFDVPVKCRGGICFNKCSTPSSAVKNGGLSLPFESPSLLPIYRYQHGRNKFLVDKSAYSVYHTI